MKRILIIFLSFLFLLPSVGIHVDMSHCCGSIENLGLSHATNIKVGSCCHLEKSSACDTDKEIIQAPTYQDLALGDKYSIKDKPNVIWPSSFVSPKILSKEHVIHSLTSLTPLYRHSTSFLQVFLC